MPFAFSVEHSHASIGARTADEAQPGGAMGLVTFDDAAGVRWRVWRVELPSSRAHLMDPEFRGGWLVFERMDERERRRMSRVPDDWTSLPPERLADLLAMAVPVTTPRSQTSEQLRTARPPDPET
jgi:hypothetical protein